jgi:hypothetical protein
MIHKIFSFPEERKRFCVHYWRLKHQTQIFRDGYFAPEHHVKIPEEAVVTSMRAAQ